MDINIRKSSTFAAVILAAFLAMISVAAACVTFKGKMTVDGHDGDTTVVGSGNDHRYCIGGEPTTAAAGHLADSITISVSSASCGDLLGGSPTHQLPNGTYTVAYNNRASYVGVDGTRWTMIPQSGCFFPTNASTTSTLGSFTVSGGSGSWTGTLGSLAGPLGPLYSEIGEASNICVGAGGNGMLAPYRLLI